MRKPLIVCTVAVAVVFVIVRLCLSRHAAEVAAAPAGPSVSGPRKLVVSSYGGSYQESQRRAFFEPFTRETGIKIVEASYTGDFAKIKAMVETGNVIWDAIVVESALLLRGTREGLWEPIDYSNIDKAAFIPEAVHKYGIGDVVYSTVIAYSTVKYPKGSRHPQSWAEFWDVERFPGPRALRRNPVGVLEAALLADGVAPESLYAALGDAGDLDLTRALKSLDRIRDHIAVWWEAGSQPPQLLADRQVDLSSAYNGRVYTAAKEDGQSIAVEWGQGLMDMGWWVVPKGGRRTALAMQFIAFAVQAKRQAELTRHIAYGPTNKEAIELVSGDIAEDLPTYPANLAKQILLNNEWWAQHEAEALERWNEWLLKK